MKGKERRKKGGTFFPSSFFSFYYFFGSGAQGKGLADFGEILVFNQSQKILLEIG